MDEASITQYIMDTFDGVDVVIASRESGAPEVAWGDRFFSYDPGRQLPPNRWSPFATIVTKDYGDFDCASQLNREGVYRLNIGVSKATYISLFAPRTPVAPESVAQVEHDFTLLDRLLPHPLYASMYWVCVLNPCNATFQAVQPLLADAYQLAVCKYAKHEPLA